MARLARRGTKCLPLGAGAALIFALALACRPRSSGTVALPSGVASSDSEKLDLAFASSPVDVVRFVRVLEDCVGLTFEQVSAADTNVRFAPPAARSLSFGYSACSYWLRLAIKGATAPSRADEWLLVLANPRVDAFELYERRGEVLNVVRSGALLPSPRRPISSRQIALPLNVPSGEDATLYIRLQTSDVAAFPLTLMRHEAFARAERVSHMAFGIYYGLFMFCAGYGILFFAFLRDRTYLYYALVIVCYGFFEAAVNGFASEYLWPASPEWSMRSIPFFCGAAVAAGALFSGALLRVGEYARHGATALRCVTVAGLLLALGATFAPLAVTGAAGSALALVVVVLIGLLSWQAALRRRPYALHFVLGGGLFLVGLSLNALRNFGLLSNTILTAFGNQLGSVMLSVLLLVALASRFVALRRDKEKAQAEAFRSRQETSENLRIAAEFKLQALQSKINPHFLFNALNTIAGLIAEAPARAEDAVVKLGRLFRYALHATETQCVPLERELDIVRSYLEIEQLRFGERLRWEIDVRGDVTEVTIPGLTIQPLVENCVKHGLRPKPEGGSVIVRVERAGSMCRLIVEDDGVGIQPDDSRSGPGHGLANVKERLRLAYGEQTRMRLTNGKGLRAEIDLPVLPVPRVPLVAEKGIAPHASRPTG